MAANPARLRLKLITDGKQRDWKLSDKDVAALK
jgi:hypothetical protein